MLSVRGRDVTYLRLSLTEVCNFRCQYCLPRGYQPRDRTEAPLSVPQVRRLVKAFVNVGIRKVRLTGGEPTLRPDFLDIVRSLAANQRIEQLALTTNGYRLAERVESYILAGIQRLNVSLDSLDSRRFETITGRDCLPNILEGLEIAIGLPFEALHVNAVLTPNCVELELPAFLDWVGTRSVMVRFIEVMPTRANLPFRHQASGSVVVRLKSRLDQLGWQPVPRADMAGPATVYAHRGFAGTIGIIAPSKQGFCRTCNRVRVDAFGRMNLCLWGRERVCLAPWLQSDEQRMSLMSVLRAELQKKPRQDTLASGWGEVYDSLSHIGG